MIGKDTLNHLLINFQFSCLPFVTENLQSWSSTVIELNSVTKPLRFMKYSVIFGNE